MGQEIKVTPALAEQLQRQDDSGVIDLVVELQRLTGLPEGGLGSRSARIAALKQTFERCATPVVDAIQQAGGNVTGHAWINQTMRAQVPVRYVDQLAARDDIATLDIPRSLATDAG